MMLEQITVKEFWKPGWNPKEGVARCNGRGNPILLG